MLGSTGAASEAASGLGVMFGRELDVAVGSEEVPLVAVHADSSSAPKTAHMPIHLDTIPLTPVFASGAVSVRLAIDLDGVA